MERIGGRLVAALAVWLAAAPALAGIVPLLLHGYGETGDMAAIGSFLRAQPQ